MYPWFRVFPHPPVNKPHNAVIQTTITLPHGYKPLQPSNAYWKCTPKDTSNCTGIRRGILIEKTINDAYSADLNRCVPASFGIHKPLRFLAGTRIVMRLDCSLGPACEVTRILQSTSAVSSCSVYIWHSMNLCRRRLIKMNIRYTTFHEVRYVRLRILRQTCVFERRY